VVGAVQYSIRQWRTLVQRVAQAFSLCAVSRSKLLRYLAASLTTAQTGPAAALLRIIALEPKMAVRAIHQT